MAESTAAASSAFRAPPRFVGFKLLLAGLALGFLTWLAYSNSFSAELTLDSKVLIGDDPRVTAVTQENLHNVFWKTVWWPTYESNLYRPLTTLSYLFNYAVLKGGTAVIGYHVFNFIIHWANVWLVLVIIRRLTGRLELAALAAALFAVHPVNTESVTNIVGRADLLATLSILFGGWCYMRAGDSRGWRKVAWLCGTGLNACWGIYAKESAVMICAFVFLYDLFWRWPHLPGKNLLQRLGQAFKTFVLQGYVALIPMAVLLGVTRYILYQNTPVSGEIFVDNPIVGADSWWQAKMTAIKVLGRYLALLVYPRTLSADYSYNQIPLFGKPGGEGEDFFAWVSLTVIVALLWTAFRLRRSQPLYAWGVCFFFLMMLPTANLLFPIGSIMGERFLYLPSIGFCAVAAQGLWWLGAAIARRAGGHTSWIPDTAWALPALVLIALTLRTHARNYDWQNDRALWASALTASPESFKAWKGYATSILTETPGEKSLDTAIAHAEIALAILDHPLIPVGMQDETVYIDLGKYYLAKGQFLLQRDDPAGARAYFQKSADVLLRARAVDVLVNEGSRAAQLKKGRKAEDVPDVGNYRIYEWLGHAYDHLGDWPACEATGRYIQRLQPQMVIGYQMAGVACFQQGNLQEAVVQFLEGLLMDKNNTDLWRFLATCYAKLGVQPFPIQAEGQGYKLDANTPIVRTQLDTAGVTLVRNFEAAKQFAAAKAIEQNLIQYMGFKPQQFQKP